MKLEIILTNYIKKYSYTDLALSNIILLQREVMKKAYQDGLYFIGTKKELENSNSIKLYPGLPSIEDILDTNLNKTLDTIKISLPYEDIMDFVYNSTRSKKALTKTIPLNKLKTKKVKLYLDKDLTYKEDKISLTKLDELIIINELSSNIKNYKYYIENNVNKLNEEVINFISTNKKYIENEDNLETIKVILETLQI